MAADRRWSVKTALSAGAAALAVLALGAWTVARAQGPETPVVRAETSQGAYLAGETALGMGDTRTAAAFFQRAADMAPSQAEPRERAFSVTLIAGDVDRAAQFAPRKGQSDAAAVALGELVIAVSDLANGRAGDANQILGGPGLAQSGEAAAKLLRPWAAAAAGDWKLALAAPASTGDKFTDAFAVLGRGLLLEHAGKLDEADAVFKGLKPAGESLFAQIYGGFLERHGRRPEAIALYQSVLKAAPNDVAMRLALKRAEAGGPPPGAPSLASGAAQALTGPAALLLAQRQPEAGLSYLRLALRLDPNRSEAWVLLGETLEGLGDSAGARAAFAKVQPAADDYAAARARLALDYAQNKQKDEALKVARETVAALPDDPSSKLVLAELLRDSEHYDEALAILNGLLANQKEDTSSKAKLLYLIGANEERSGKWAAAEGHLRAALAISPNDPEILNYLGFAWADRGEHLDEALGMLSKAVDLAPDNAAIIDSYGWAKYRLKDHAGAVPILERAATLDPTEPECNTHLGDAYWRVGRKLEAEFQWNYALTLPDVEPKLKAAVEQRLRDHRPPDAR